MLVKINCQICQSRKLFRYSIKTMFLFMLGLSVFFLGSCDSIKLSSKNEKVPLRLSVSVDELQSQLDDFGEIFTNRTKSAAAEIDYRTEDPKTRKMTLLWRSRAIAALQNVHEQPKPIIALIDSWLLCLRMNEFFQSGQGSNTFGDFQNIAVMASKELEAQIEDIANKVLPKEIFDQTYAELKRLTAANPIQSDFGKILMYSTQTKTEQPGFFQSIINIPLSPVRALEGVDRTPEAIYDFSNTTQRMADVVQELPESTRWQLLLLLYDLEETKMANSFLKSLQDISQSSSKLSQTAEHFSLLLEDPNQNQAQIRQTLNQVSETSVNLQNLLKTTQQTVAEFSRTAQAVDNAASSWTQAAKATKETIEQFQPKGDKGNVEQAEKMDLKETADAIRLAATEIRLASEKLPDKAELIMSRINSLITRITICLALLALLIFSLFVSYRFLKNKNRI